MCTFKGEGFRTAQDLAFSFPCTHLLTLVLWWVDLGWLPSVYQAVLSLPLLSRMGGENTKKKLVSQDKDWEIACQLVIGKIGSTCGKINLPINNRVR